MGRTPPRLRQTRIWVFGGILLLLSICVGAIALLGSRAAVSPVERRPLAQKIVANGRVRVPVRVRLGTTVGGVVARVLVDKGDLVRPGDLVLELENGEALAEVAQASARLQQVRELDTKVATEELQQAEVSLAQAERQFRRTRALADSQVIAPQQLEEAKEARDLAASRKASGAARLKSSSPGGGSERLAAAQLAAAQARLALTQVRSPASGTIIDRLVLPGDVVAAGQPLIDLAQDGPTWLTVQPEEKNLAFLRVGQIAQASVDAFPDSVFTARITRLAPAIDPARGTVEVDLAVDRPPPFLRPDMTVSIDIEVARHESALTLPADLIRQAADTPWVLVVSHRRAERRPVSLGLRGEGMVEIVSGLREGDLVISPEEVKIRPGARVRPVLPRH